MAPTNVVVGKPKNKLAKKDSQVLFRRVIASNWIFLMRRPKQQQMHPSVNDLKPPREARKKVSSEELLNNITDLEKVTMS